MDFGLDEDQRLLQHTVLQYLENEFPVQRMHEVFDGDDPYDATLWRGLGELGLFGVLVPERHGGAELGLLDLTVVAEVLGHEAASGPFLGHVLAALAITLGGSDAQRERWLPQLAEGSAMATFAAAEASGWEPEDWGVTLEAGRLSGRKSFVLLGSEADLIVVGTQSGGLALVESNADGLKSVAVDGLDRTRRLWNLELSSTPCEVLPDGASVAGRVRDAGLCLLAADAFGGALRCVEMSIAYAKEREQFGVKIGEFQGLKHQLADMAVAAESTRGLYWYAAHAWDALPDQCERLAALAKAHITDTFAQVARDAVEAHGAIGFTWEENLQVWLKRSTFDHAYLGSPGHHRERAARLAGW
jgi:alkylation response protein AidB-like acyl-CoA dehydrogenase